MTSDSNGELEKRKFAEATDELAPSGIRLNATQPYEPTNGEDSSGVTVDYLPPDAKTGRGDQSPGSITASRYSRIREHAKGGLGLVFLAQDHELQREVALKEIQPQFIGSSESNTRFLLEAQLTGQLEHPGIVPIYGLGQYPDGRPYYAMRFIRGESFQQQIDRFHGAHASKNSSDFDARDFRGLILRFIDVCNAIHYAHEKGVIHRDIKPANVMLGKYGETLVVDWGLAKLLRANSRTANDSQAAARPQSNHVSSTLDGAAMGTPLYMSPEQAMGLNQELTPASDIYSLGATLVTLVTGARPVDGKSRAVVLENVRQGRIRNVRTIVPTAPKALDAICRKAMMIEPAKRYQSAKALAEDLDRWLADEAVEALRGQESWIDISGRLMRRYRSWTVSVAVAILLISAMSVLAALVVNDARQKEQLAKIEAREYRQDALDRYRMSRSAIDSWLVDSSEALTYFPATQSIRKELLTRAAKDYTNLSESASADPELKLESIRALARVGDIQLDQEEYAKARASYEKALAAFDAVPVISSDSDDLLIRWRAERARTHCQLGILYTAELQTKHAETQFTQAINELDSLRARHPQVPLVNQTLAKTLNSQAAMLVEKEKYSEALPLLERAVAIFSHALDSGNEHDLLAASIAQTGLGRVLGKLGRHTEAAAAFSMSITQLVKLSEETPDQPLYVDALANAFVSRAATQQALGNRAEQLKDLREAAQLYGSLQLALPDVPRFAEAHAITLTDIGLVLYEADSLTDSLASLLAAREEFTKLVNYYPRVPSFRSNLAAALDGASQVYREQARASEAVDAGNLAYRLYEDLANEAAAKKDGQVAHNVERAAVVLSHIAQIRAASGEDTAALESFNQAIGYLKQLCADAPSIPDYRHELAHVLFYMGSLEAEQKLVQAQEHFAAALALWSDLTNQYEAAEYAAQLARFHLQCPLRELRDAHQALAAANKATQLAPANRCYLLFLAEAQAIVGSVDESLQTLNQVREMGDATSANYWLVTARIRFAKKDAAGARAALQAAIQWAGDNRPGNVELQRKLAEGEELLK